MQLAAVQNISCLLDSHATEQKMPYHNFDAILAFEPDKIFRIYRKIPASLAKINDWLFGFISYDYKHKTHQLVANNPAAIKMPLVLFFVPKKLIFIKGQQLIFLYHEDLKEALENDFKQLSNFDVINPKPQNNAIVLESISRETYLDAVRKMQHHIKLGNIYEANYCIEFLGKKAVLNPLETFIKLNDLSKAPMSTFFKYQQKYLLSASPERYLKRVKNKVISEPIKGTAKRGVNQTEDEQLKISLQSNAKEQSENVMIVDLVRNDLSVTALPGSVNVEALFKVYTFEQVHQMISSISSKVGQNTTWVDLINTTFPMGSMTGAPKHAAMTIIESLETFKRGLYSGTVGYVTPEGDFDFNVVIRSLIYDRLAKKVSFAVGSAITINAIAEQEYQECLLKAKAMKRVLGVDDEL